MGAVGAAVLLVERAATLELVVGVAVAQLLLVPIMALAVVAVMALYLFGRGK